MYHTALPHRAQMSRHGFIIVSGGKRRVNRKKEEGSMWKREVALVCWDEGCLFQEIKLITFYNNICLEQNKEAKPTELLQKQP